MTPQEYLVIRNENYAVMDKCREVIADARKKAETNNYWPRWLRDAGPTDIVVDQVIWYNGDYWSGWKIVAEVIHPNDPWKAYSAEDGCRYGLDGAMVEFEPA